MNKLIIIDTSIFIQENFFIGRKLERLATLSSKNHIQLAITSVIHEEIKSNIKKNISESIQAADKYKRDLERKYKIVKNLIDINSLHFVNDNYTEALLEKYIRFLEYSKIIVIEPIDSFNIKNVLERYFNSLPPFHNLTKKNEFPDAISLQITEDYCKMNNLSATFVTTDTDLLSVSSEQIEFTSNLNGLIEQILNDLDPKLLENRNQILEFIKDDEKQFIPLIKEQIQLEIFIYLFYLFEEEISTTLPKFEIINFSIETYKIFDIGEKHIGFECSGNFSMRTTYILGDSLSLEKHNQIILENNIKQKQIGVINFKGSFNINIYFNFEYPYKAIEYSIEPENQDIVDNLITE